MERTNTIEGYLRDKVAIITGGSTGIGKAIVKKFISEGDGGVSIKSPLPF